MHQSDELLVMKLLKKRDGKMKRKKLLKKMQKKSILSSEDTNMLLKEMCSTKRLKAVEEGKNIIYCIVSSTTDNDSENSSSDTDTNDMKEHRSRIELENISIDNEVDNDSIPFAERMRRKMNSSISKEKSANKSTKKKRVSFEEDENIDDEIKRLEAELADESESESDSDDENSKENNVDNIDGMEKTVISLSNFVEERIPSLPQSALPLPQKSKRLKVDRDMDNELEALPRKKKSRTQNIKVNDGLKAAVREVLGNYVARSSEKLPFYCRVCAKQLSNFDEFREHKQTEMHKIAVREEEKMSYCRLCRKQFTSPAQLKEHLQARPHKQRLANEKAKQAQWKLLQNECGGELGTLKSSRQWK